MKPTDKVKIKGSETIYTIHYKIEIGELPVKYRLRDVEGKISEREYDEWELEIYVPVYTPERISALKKNEIFVFGSNTQGRHGAGAAKTALELFGAKYGVAKGLQGRSYGLITTDLTTPELYPLELIEENILEFIGVANSYPHLTFYMTKVGTALAGYTVSVIANVFKKCHKQLPFPVNVILPKEFEMRW